MKEEFLINTERSKVPFSNHRPQDDIPYEQMMKRIIEDYRKKCETNDRLHSRVHVLEEQTQRLSKNLQDSERLIGFLRKENQRLLKLIQQAAKLEEENRQLHHQNLFLQNALGDNT